MNLKPSLLELKQIVLIIIGQLLLVLWALKLVTPEEGISLMWLPDGYLLGCLVLLKPRLWPTLLILLFFSIFTLEHLSTDRSTTMILSFIFSNMFESILNSLCTYPTQIRSKLFINNRDSIC